MFLLSSIDTTDEHTNERFLVDFEKKSTDEILSKKKMMADLEEEVGDDDGELEVATVPTREEMMKQKAKEVESSEIPPAANQDEEW